MSENKPLIHEFTKGILKENPVLCLVLGTCPTLAVTTGVSSALGMGIAATVVLVCSNSVISALRKVIPTKVRIPAYITIIAAFVTIVQMIVKAYAPTLNDALGVYLPLIVVNCIILGRAEMFASKNGIAASAHGCAVFNGKHKRDTRRRFLVRSVDTCYKRLSDFDFYSSSWRIFCFRNAHGNCQQAEFQTC